MPWLYDGFPDGPQWWREWYKKRWSKREIRRDIRAHKKGKSLIDEKWLKRAQRRSRRRRAVVGVITARSFTFSLQLIGGPLVALQMDRLTLSEGGGSWLWLLVGVAMLALSVWLARSREVHEEYVADRHESAWLSEQFRQVVADLESRIDQAEQADYEAREEILGRLRVIYARVEADDRW